ncbi:hypothetical protein RAB80_014420 [Fusarium oxysporum f. sp. vasinfectum]|nr:hypothetical protein RAB80_014420 [Fusarium oxysporum f. sp. vasinfectum]
MEPQTIDMILHAFRTWDKNESFSLGLFANCSAGHLVSPNKKAAFLGMIYRICSPSELWGDEVGLMLGYSGAIEVFPARFPSRK